MYFVSTWCVQVTIISARTPLKLTNRETNRIFNRPWILESFQRVNLRLLSSEYVTSKYKVSLFIRIAVRVPNQTSPMKCSPLKLRGQEADGDVSSKVSRVPVLALFSFVGPRIHNFCKEINFLTQKTGTGRYFLASWGYMLLWLIEALFCSTLPLQ